MEAEFVQRLNEMSVDFKVKIKNHIHEFEKVQEVIYKKNTDNKYRSC